MSAFLVDVETIDALISAWIALGDPRSGWRASAGPNRADRQERATEIGRDLWRANLDNLEALYPSDIAATNLRAVVDGYTFTACPIEPTTIRILFGRILKLLASYEYQCNDRDAWEKSAACRFVESLRLEIIARLPGYADGPWGTTDRRNVWKVS